MSGRYERRIGRRIEVTPVAVGWRVRSPTKGRGVRRRRSGGQPAALIDVSVSGLRVRAPAAKDLWKGMTVLIEIQGVVGAVSIRRIVPVEGTDLVDYGVQVVASSHELARWCSAALDGDDEIEFSTPDHRFR